MRHAVVYLAVRAEEQRRVHGDGRGDGRRARSFGTLEVPARFRNAPTRLMKELGYGKGYRYAHDEPDAFAAGERYLPDEMPDRRYYRPVPRGLEIKIGEALARLRSKPTADQHRRQVRSTRDRLKLLRSDPEAVARNLARRGFALDVAALQALEERRKQAQIEADRLRAERNAHAKAVGMAKGQGRGHRAADGAAARTLDAGARERRAAARGRAGGARSVAARACRTCCTSPCPTAAMRTANVEVRRWGEPRKFDFKPRDHVELGEKLGGLDFEAAARISGARFVGHALAASRGCIARSVSSCSTCTRASTATPKSTCRISCSRAALIGTGQLPKFEQDLFAVRRRARAVT